MKILLKNPKDQ
ncbi:hypothetical protein KSF78_0009469 [Schistosoma japonicum]|nr:hypothetical protein KSF78_0009469 [Schistosoma japonicum]